MEEVTRSAEFHYLHERDRIAYPDPDEQIAVAVHTTMFVNLMRELGNVAAEGIAFTTATIKAVHVHPALRVELESRQLFALLWSSMHLDCSHTDDG